MLRTSWPWRSTLARAVVRGARDDADDQLARRAATGASSAPTRLSICGLMRQHDDVRALDRLAVGLDRPDAVLAAQMRRAARRADGWRRSGRRRPARP